MQRPPQHRDPRERLQHEDQLPVRLRTGESLPDAIKSKQDPQCVECWNHLRTNFRPDKANHRRERQDFAQLPDGGRRRRSNGPGSEEQGANQRRSVRPIETLAAAGVPSPDAAHRST